MPRAKLYRVNYEETAYFETFLEAESEEQAREKFRATMEQAQEDTDILAPIDVDMGMIDVEEVDE